jgi:hypothetical protein
MSNSCCIKLIEDLNCSDKVHCFTSKTSAEENSKTFRIENKSNKNICRVKVDGCLIDSRSDIKCDYLFKICDTNEYFLVELKGREGIAHAIDQISSTYKIINKTLNLHKNCFTGFVVASEVPGANQKSRNIIERKRSQAEIKIELSSQKKIKII